MQEKLPNVRGRKIWVVIAIFTAAAFFVLWSLRNGDTPRALSPASPLSTH